MAQYTGPKPTVTECVYHDVSPPLADIVPHPSLPKAGDLEDNELPDVITPPKAGALPIGEDPVWQKENGSKGTVSPYRNFEALRNSDNSSGVAPPDSDGDVSPDYYFAMVNNVFQIFNRSGSSVYGPAGNTTIWDGWGGYSGQSISDPIVLWDEQAERWFASVFVTTTISGYYRILVAVSQTSSPLGSWNRYYWEFSSKPDYPKYGIWPDGYYLGVNRTGDDVLVLERSAMIAGTTADMVSFDNPGKPVPNNTTFNCVLPSDCDGAFPAYGTPNYFWGIGDDAWSAYSTDRLLVWEFHVDWNTPSNSTWTGPTAINTAAFDATFNAFGVGEITQPGTSQVLDCIPWILMYRPQFRNFGSYFSLVCNHTVDVDATNHAGIRWYELRKTTGGWYIRQQNTYSPDGDNRFFGSVAMNAKGDIAMGYSVSSTSTYPSIRFTGRLADDPLNTMTFTESNIWAGSYSQTDSRRWGDYSMMSVDPVNDHSFWFISEYAGNYGGWADWITQVAAFTLDDYCAASSTYFTEYISNVSIGSINNFSGNEQYSNYTNLSTNINNSSTAALTVTAGNYYSGDDVSVWVDWNDDNDFSDANEFIGNDATEPFTFTIDPPTGVIIGEHRMRVRLSYTYGIDPCGVSNYGEVEDYTINVTGIAGLWTGAVSSNWFTPGNWDNNAVPTSTDNVSIPAGTPYQPVIGAGTAYCQNLYLQTGASLTQNTNSYFYCYGTFDAGFGQFTMSGTSYLYFDGSGNSIWYDDNQNDTYTYVRVNKDVSTAIVTLPYDMTCTGNFEIREGVLAMSTGRTLSVTNTGTTAFEVEDGGKLILDSSTEGIDISGSIRFFDGSQATLTSGTINCGGNFTVDANTSYNIVFSSGTLVMDGSSTQYINDLDSGMLDLDNLTIDKSGGVCYIQSANLDVNDGVLISGGTLSCDNGPSPTVTYNINVAGNWTNNVGTTGFDESTGRVIFDGGNYHQYCSNETFNELEINKPLGGAFRTNGTNVVCAAYDWTAGAVDVLTGSFTANDLLDNAVQGGYYLNAGGTINLTNSGSGLYVDLKGDLHIFGGTMTVSGSISEWPYLEDASIEMSAGVLDFTSCGIIVSNNAYALTDNITGGTIRTSVGFSGNRADFTPTAGIFEFYGTTDAYLSQTNGCALNAVVIDKATKGSLPYQPYIKVSKDERVDATMGDGSKDNNISLTNDFVVTNYLTVNSGSLTLSGYELTVAHSCNVYGTLNMNNAADIINVGATYSDRLWFYSGSIGNLNEGVANIYGWFQPEAGCSVTGSLNHTVIFKGVTGGGPNNNEPTATYGNIEIFKNAGERTYISASATQPIVVNGNVTVHPNNEFELQEETMIVNGLLIDNSSSEIYTYNAAKNGGTDAAKDKIINQDQLVQQSPDLKAEPIDGTGAKGSYLEIDGDFTLNGLLDVGDGEVYVHGHYTQPSTATLTIGSGSFICDEPTTVLCSVYGNFNLSTGLFEISNNHLRLNAVCSISGGIIRSGGTFWASIDGNFQPTAGAVELIGTGSSGQYISVHANNYFHDLTINRTNMISIYTGTDLNIKNNFTILGGGLNSNTRDITIGGTWDNTVGTNAFNESTGKVVFNKATSSVQNINSDENFNIIENNTADQIRISSLQDTVTCNSYNWISGGIGVYQGTFIAYDLAQDGLYGNIYALAGSKIYLNQEPGQYIDMFSDWIYISDGMLKITGGDDESYWCTSAPLTLDIINGGILDFDGYGITIFNNQPLTENITTGNIRTSGWFTCSRPDFNPTSGTTEFYGGNDSYINFTAGSSLADVLINKSGGLKTSYTFKDRDGKIQTGSKSNSVYLDINDLDVMGNLDIDAGTLGLSGETLNCYGNVNVNNGGILQLLDNSTCALDNTSDLYVNNGGWLLTIGSAGNPVTFTHINGYYDLWIQDGGYISAEHTLFEYMSTSGVYVRPGSTVNSVNAFNNCTFQNGYPGGYLLTLYNDQALTASNVVFPTNTWGSGYNVYKNSGSNSVYFHNASGGFAGPAYELDPGDDVYWTTTAYDLALEVFLEGPFNESSTKMDLELYDLGLIPTSQPFNSNPLADWYYTGTESVGSIPEFVVDWVLVELRDAPNVASASPGRVIARQAGFLLNNGEVVGMDGLNPLDFDAAIFENLYVVIWQRNHLGVISANPLVNVGGTYSYGFFSGSGQAYGGTSAQVELSPGIWGILSGDGNGNGSIGLPDKINIWTIQAGDAGYLPGDFNLDGQINNPDKDDFWVPNFGADSYIPE